MFRGKADCLLYFVSFFCFAFPQPFTQTKLALNRVTIQSNFKNKIVVCFVESTLDCRVRTLSRQATAHTTKTATPQQNTVKQPQTKIRQETNKISCIVRRMDKLSLAKTTESWYNKKSNKRFDLRKNRHVETATH